MKKIILISLLFIPLLALSQTEPNYEGFDAEIAWVTDLKNVLYVAPDTFSVDVAPLSTRDPGASPLRYGNWLVDSRGFRYKIIDTTSAPTIIVYDAFKEDYAPSANRIGIVYKSAGGGNSPSLPTFQFDQLQRKALEYGYGRDMSILWQQLASKSLLASRIGTSISWGGEMDTITGSPTTFNIAAGSGTIVDSYTNPEIPDVTVVEWDSLKNITATGVGVRNITYIYIDTLGNVVQSATLITNEEKRDLISIGTLVHPLGTGTVTAAVNVVNWNADIYLSFSDFLDAVGNRFNMEGNEFSANGANTKINRSAGKMYGLGLNYGVSKHDPNVVESISQSAISFFLAYRGGVGLPAIAAISDTIPTHYYDPNGDGVLVPIPTGYCTTHRIYYDPITNFTIVQYGQFVYDSQKKAIDSYKSENYDRISEINRVPLRCVVVACEGETDLSDRDNGTYINVNQFSDSPYDKIPNFDEYAEGVELLDGMSYKQQSIYFTDDGVNVYLEVERNPIYGGGDMTYVLGQREYTLDCTTGTGVGGRAKIQLLLGSDNDARLQYVYITKSGEKTVQLNVSESKPSGGDYAMIGRGALRSFAKYVEDGRKPFVWQRYTQAKEKDGISMIISAAEKLRAQGAETSASYGPVPLIEIVQGTPDSLNVQVSSGGVYQFYYGIFQSLSSKVDGIRVLNPHASETFGALDYIYNLADIQYDASGNTLNNRSFNFELFGARNTANGDSIDWIGVAVPSSTYSYNSTESAITNLGGYAVTSVPTEADQVAFLICRVALRYKNGDWENLTLSETGLNYFDQRGLPLGTESGGTGTPSPTPVFNDNTFQVENASDATKIFKVNVANVTTANTRTLDIPDKNGTIALLDDLDNFADTLKVANLDTIGTRWTQSQVIGLVDTITQHRADINQNASDILNIETNYFNKLVDDTDDITEGVTNLWDKTVSFSGGTNVTIGGTYPNFTITDNSKADFTENTGFNKDFGTIAGTVAQGNDSRFITINPTNNYIPYRTSATTFGDSPILANGDNASLATNSFLGFDSNVTTSTYNIQVNNSTIGSDFGLFISAYKTSSDRWVSLGGIVDGTTGIITPQVNLNTKTGNLLIGTTTDNGVDKLQVNGSGYFSSTVIADPSTLDTELITQGQVNTALGDYLPLTGGTLTGNLAITKDFPVLNLTDNGAGQSGSVFILANSTKEYRMNLDYQAIGVNDLVIRDHTRGVSLLNFTSATGEATFSAPVNISTNQPYLVLEDITASEGDAYLVANQNKFYINFDTPSAIGAYFQINKTTNETTLSGTATAASFTATTGETINEFSSDGTLAGNSDTAVPTEKAVKTYVDGIASVSFGSSTQVPYMNVNGDDFIYSSNLTFNGTKLTTDDFAAGSLIDMNGGTGKIQLSYSSYQEAAADVTPTSGYGSLYHKNDGRIYMKNDSGEKYDLTNASGYERSSDPSTITNGYVIWQSDGTGSGDNGDIMIKVNDGTTTKTITLIDFSTF
jgi:hypothetical protein